MQIRRLTPDDAAASYRLGVEAFGPSSAPPTPPTEEQPGRRVWGAFDGDRLAGRVAGLELRSWWHGRAVPTCGVASVSVAAEDRGAGLLRPLFAAVLADAADRGEAVSTLFPTASGIYRGLGYEVVSSYDTVTIPTSELARVRPPAGTRTRRATAADAPAVRAVYAAWAAAQNGPLTRTGPWFGATDAELVDGFTGITLAVDRDDRVVGYAAWDRVGRYDDTGRVDVTDLLAVTGDGYRALWAVLGSFGSATATVTLRTSGADPARLLLPTATWTVTGRHPLMIRVGDPAGALTGADLGLPGLAPTEVGFAVDGDALGAADGRYRLVLGDGVARCDRVSEGAGERADVATFTMPGLALRYAGVQSCATLRHLGHLAGPSDHDALLDAVLGRRPVHVRDYY